MAKRPSDEYKIDLESLNKTLEGDEALSQLRLVSQPQSEPGDTEEGASGWPEAGAFSPEYNPSGEDPSLFSPGQPDIKEKPDESYQADIPESRSRATETEETAGARQDENVKEQKPEDSQPTIPTQTRVPKRRRRKASKKKIGDAAVVPSQSSQAPPELEASERHFAVPDLGSMTMEPVVPSTSTGAIKKQSTEASTSTASSSSDAFVPDISQMRPLAGDTLKKFKMGSNSEDLPSPSDDLNISELELQALIEDLRGLSIGGETAHKSYISNETLFKLLEGTACTRNVLKNEGEEHRQSVSRPGSASERLPAELLLEPTYPDVRPVSLFLHDRPDEQDEEVYLGDQFPEPLETNPLTTLGDNNTRHHLRRPHFAQEMSSTPETLTPSETDEDEGSTSKKDDTTETASTAEIDSDTDTLVPSDSEDPQPGPSTRQERADDNIETAVVLLERPRPGSSIKVSDREVLHTYRSDKVVVSGKDVKMVPLKVEVRYASPERSGKRRKSKSKREKPKEEEQSQEEAEPASPKSPKLHESQTSPIQHVSEPQANKFEFFGISLSTTIPTSQLLSRVQPNPPSSSTERSEQGTQTDTARTEDPQASTSTESETDIARTEDPQASTSTESETDTSRTEDPPASTSKKSEKRRSDQDLIEGTTDDEEEDVLEELSSVASGTTIPESRLKRSPSPSKQPRRPGTPSPVKSSDPNEAKGEYLPKPTPILGTVRRTLSFPSQDKDEDNEDDEGKPKSEGEDEEKKKRKDGSGPKD